MNLTKNVDLDNTAGRIEWVDIFKAICISAMVIGHAWGGANSFIYQFHMAALFFISGFTANLQKRNLEDLFFNKTLTLIIPIFTMIVILSPIAHIIDGSSPVDSIMMIKDDLRNYIIWGAVVNLLGAVWFLPTLFIIFFIHRILFKISTEHGGIIAYLLLTIIIFLGGYYLWYYNFRDVYFLDVALLAQFYFGAGVVFKSCRCSNYRPNTAISMIMIVIGFALMFIMTKMDFQVTMDLVSRNYPRLIVMAVVPFFGILLTYGLSHLISKIDSPVKKPILELGKNTIGVLFLHFVCFKITTLFFIVLGVAKFSDLKVFLMPDFVLQNQWISAIYVIVSLITSVAIWKSLKEVPVLRRLLGQRD